MPGHMDGIDCMVSFNVASIGPFNGSNRDWARLERDIRDGLKITGGGHTVRDVNIFHMHAAGVSIGKVASALARTPGTSRQAQQLVRPNLPRKSTRKPARKARKKT